LQSPSAAQRKKGLQGLEPGERVVVEGAVQLKAALEEVQARYRQERAREVAEGKRGK
jgi:hypothetical protein